MSEEQGGARGQSSFVGKWVALGVIGLLAGVGLWVYACMTHGRQDSAVTVGGALFVSGVVLLTGAKLAEKIGGS